MTKTLPHRPDLAWLKKSAKERLAELRASDPGAKLHQAQRAIAGDHGFPSWRALKARVDARSLDSQIIAAAVQGDAAVLGELLAAHPAKLHLTGSGWNRPLLHLAAEAGHLACVDVLLRHGFDVRRRDKFDNATALHWAAQGGHVAVVEHLLEAGADIDGKGDLHEVGVIGWAARFRDVHADAAEFLLARGAERLRADRRRLDLVRSLEGVPAGQGLNAAVSIGVDEYPRRVHRVALQAPAPDGYRVAIPRGVLPDNRKHQAATDQAALHVEARRSPAIELGRVVDELAGDDVGGIHGLDRHLRPALVLPGRRGGNALGARDGAADGQCETDGDESAKHGNSP